MIRELRRQTHFHSPFSLYSYPMPPKTVAIRAGIQSPEVLEEWGSPVRGSKEVLVEAPAVRALRRQRTSLLSLHLPFPLPNLLPSLPSQPHRNRLQSRILRPQITRRLQRVVPVKLHRVARLRTRHKEGQSRRPTIPLLYPRPRSTPGYHPRTSPYRQLKHRHSRSSPRPPRPLNLGLKVSPRGPRSASRWGYSQARASSQQQRSFSSSASASVGATATQ